MIIGVISDTHNYFDPQLPHILSAADHILHAGDIGYYNIIQRLEEIAPVTAVLGNNDSALDLRETQLVSLGGRKFLLHHILDPGKPTRNVEHYLARERPDVIVFGHSHQPYCESRDGILYLNPGYAGRPRFNLPRSLALLYVEADGIRSEFFSL